ncbi:tetratricopeptide repeat protein [uncultured Winogradskyella sp.]|uniref:tetratricopeptide repeat protein n=1 Tax=uncultured Winogradskyella sp. TaxID=395353 RepID=UPI0026248839|nr:tetratricopeptide repeat protein [uncultured Winogradskyella sp.]
MDINDISQEEFEMIEAYINGQLSNEDLLAFEGRLKNEKLLALKVENIKTILTGIETQVMKEQLDEFHNNLSHHKNETVVHQPKVKILHWKRIAVAAILMMSLGGFWIFNGNPNERLYAKYFTPDPGLPTTMSTSDNYEFYEAMVYYKQGDYKSAISKWETLQIAKPNNDSLNYFIGVAYMASKNETKAIPFLEKSTTNKSFTFLMDAYYYLGLAYLKTDHIELAKKNFNKSANKNSKALLSELAD